MVHTVLHDLPPASSPPHSSFNNSACCNYPPSPSLSPFFVPLPGCPHLCCLYYGSSVYLATKTPRKLSRPLQEWKSTPPIISVPYLLPLESEPSIFGNDRLFCLLTCSMSILPQSCKLMTRVRTVSVFFPDVYYMPWIVTRETGTKSAAVK